MTERHDPWASAFVAQLNAAAKPSIPTGRFVPENPRPCGVMRHGSGTHMVYELLRECPGRFFEAGEVMAVLGLSRGTVSWGLLYLAKQGLIDAVPNPRNERYQKYAARKSAQAEISEPYPEACDLRMTSETPDASLMRRLWDRSLPGENQASQPLATHQSFEE